MTASPALVRPPACRVRPGDVMSKFYGESQRRVQAPGLAVAPLRGQPRDSLHHGDVIHQEMAIS